MANDRIHWRLEMKKTLQELVATFRENVIAQTEAMRHDDYRTGNRHAIRATKAWDELRSYGDKGRDAFFVLLSDSDAYVRLRAAAILLRYRNKEATEVLQEAAKQPGFVGFGASQALQRWEEGDWHLDPPDETAEVKQ